MIEIAHRVRIVHRHMTRSAWRNRHLCGENIMRHRAHRVQ